ncbi:MAG: sigma 54-interacting transcriptional regulator [Bacillota bacterium]
MLRLEGFVHSATILPGSIPTAQARSLSQGQSAVLVEHGGVYGVVFPSALEVSRGALSDQVEWCGTVDLEADPASVAALGSDMAVVLAGGQPLGYLVVREVLTALFQEERSRAEHLTSVMDATPAAIVAVDAEGRITLANPAARRLAGRKRCLLGCPPDGILGESNIQVVAKTGAPQRNRKLSIGPKTIMASSQPLGRKEGAVAVLQEVDTEALSEEIRTAREMNREMEAIFESVRDEIFVTDGDGVCLRANSASATMCGVNPEDLVGKRVTDLERSGIFHPSSVMLAIKEKRPVTVLQTVKGGKKVLATSTPVLDPEGKIFRVVCNSQDITELNRLKTLLEEREEQMRRYATEIEALRMERMSRHLVFRSSAMERVYQLAARVAQVDSTVLVTGESGVGKQVVAETIHRMSKRSEGPFVTVCCGAIPENLLESELFGYEAGAFTGALREGKPGTIEVSHGGTLFLDEIGDLPLSLQVKILHFLQNKQIVRVGGTKTRNVDTRVLAATNLDLRSMVDKREFREDLYYRLNVVPITIPPLRDRREDIPILVSHFLSRYNERYGLDKRISPDTLNLLVEYDWHGNVRELENMVERLVVTVEASIITPGHVPKGILKGSARGRPVTVSAMMPLKEAIEEVECQLIEKAYSRFGNTYKMAEVLGVNQSTIVRKMHKYIKPLAIRH